MKNVIRIVLLISFLFLITISTIVVMEEDENKKEPYVKFETEEINDLSLNQYEVTIGLIKITDDDTAVIGMYQDDEDKLIFLQKNSVVDYETIQFQFYQFDETTNVTSGSLKVRDRLYSQNGTFVDESVEYFNFTLSQGFGWIDVILPVTNVERTIFVEYLDIRFVFIHITKEANQYIERKYTKIEFKKALEDFGWKTFIVAVSFFYGGGFVNRKLKLVIGKKGGPTVGLLFGLLIGLSSTITVLLRDVIDFSDFAYFAGIALFSVVVGILNSKIDLRKYKGYHSFRKSGQQHRIEHVVNIYDEKINGTVVECVALEGLKETLKRFMGNHVIFKCNYRNRIISPGFLKAFSLAMIPGMVEKGKQRYWEFNTVDQHKMSMESVENLNNTIEILENYINVKDERYEKLKGTIVTQVNSKVDFAIRQHYKAMAVNRSDADYPDDVLEAVAQLNDKTVKAIKQELKTSQETSDKKEVGNGV